MQKKIIDVVRNNFLLILILVIGSILRFYHIDFQSVWLDEVHTLNDANPANSASEVYASIVAADPHPPLYFYIIHYLFIIFGYTPLVARLFSAVIGVAAIYAIYMLGKELNNKETGLVAALLITINGYHIYYSQEARLYAFLCLFTIFSFYYLIKYVKTPTVKAAIFYGVYTALMLYGHFFSLFALVSQMVILFIFFILIDRKDKMRFAVNTLIAGIIAAVLFLPSLKIFFAAMAIKDFWIPRPTADVYTLIFYEFFANSELLLCLFGLIMTLYFIRLADEKDTQINYKNIVANKLLLSFIVLFAWISIVVLIPLIRSYMSIPMIISRYFINVLPAIIIIIAIGLMQIQNRIIKYGFIALILIFSINDLVVVKRYYRAVNKTQFREATQFIAENNDNDEPVVTSLPWYFPYFLNNEKHKFTIIDSKLEAYVNKMTADSTLVKPFWYIDGHNRPYKISDQTQQFLDKNFVVENSIDLYDIWTKRFVPLEDVSQSLKTVKFDNLKSANGDEFRFSIESFENMGTQVKASGWAYFPGYDSNGTTIKLALIKDSKAIMLPTKKVSRNDVTLYFKSSDNLDFSGFQSTILLSWVQPGRYQLAIFAVNSKFKKEGFILTDKFIDK